MSTINDTFEAAVNPAFEMLDEKLDTPEARVLMFAIAMQESKLIYRRQIRGPARGLWQFEEGTRASRGGVWGVYLHPTSKRPLENFCEELGIECDPEIIYETLEYNDILAAGVARLLLVTDPRPLPEIGDQDAAWQYYVRNWRPGKPHPDAWEENYEAAEAYAREVDL